jgi:hypothetical protein
MKDTDSKHPLSPSLYFYFVNRKRKHNEELRSCVGTYDLDRNYMRFVLRDIRPISL